MRLARHPPTPRRAGIATSRLEQPASRLRAHRQTCTPPPPLRATRDSSDATVARDVRLTGRLGSQAASASQRGAGHLAALCPANAECFNSPTERTHRAQKPATARSTVGRRRRSKCGLSASSTFTSFTAALTWHVRDAPQASSNPLLCGRLVDPGGGRELRRYRAAGCGRNRSGSRVRPLRRRPARAAGQAALHRSATGATILGWRTILPRCGRGGSRRNAAVGSADW